MMIDKAVKIILAEGIVGMPTETVYGLAASIESEVAINKIFNVKERPFFDPLIVHVSNIDMAKSLTTSWTKTCDVLAEAFWPGALTMVLPKSEKIHHLITSGLDSVGIRFPNHPLALELISKVNTPLAAPSANKFTKTSPTTKQHVTNEFGEEVYVIDGGKCTVGIESTVVGIFDNEIKIYRPGMIGIELIKDVLNKANIQSIISYQESPVSPGAMKHHYMPRKPVSLFKKVQPTSNKSSTWIVPDSPEIAARELYSKLREMDNQEGIEIHIIIKEAFKNLDSYRGILNRLSKAKTHDFYFD
jgi:L-threonylcarbamoyladenylate synthase